MYKRCYAYFPCMCLSRMTEDSWQTRGLQVPRAEVLTPGPGLLLRFSASQCPVALGGLQDSPSSSIRQGLPWESVTKLSNPKGLALGGISLVGSGDGGESWSLLGLWLTQEESWERLNNLWSGEFPTAEKFALSSTDFGKTRCWDYRDASWSKWLIPIPY